MPAGKVACSACEQATTVNASHWNNFEAEYGNIFENGPLCHIFDMFWKMLHIVYFPDRTSGSTSYK